MGRLFVFLLGLLTLLTDGLAEKIWAPEVEFDFIVVGAGTAGAPIAARLSENPNYNVLLLEAGGEPPEFNKIPYFASGPFGGEYDWNYFSEPQTAASWAYVDNKLSVPRGKGLGGSTIINGLGFVRGNKHDYDNWEKLGNKGWGYKDVLPFFKKLEDYQSPITPGSEEYHGKGGPVAVSLPPYKTPVAQAIIDAGKELGYDNVDYNGPKQAGFVNPVFNIGNGTRCTTNDGYLTPNKNRKNLHVVTYAFVTKIKFNENKRAIGVLFERDDTLYLAPVKKEVIVSAGTNNSPQLLMLSGIGPKETLKKFDIKIVAESPGVGLNLQDHAIVGGIIFSFSKPIGLNLEKDISAENFELWERHRKGPLTVAGRCEGMAFLNSKYADPKIDWPDIQFEFVQPPAQSMNLKEEYVYSFVQDEGALFVIQPIVLRPKSRGVVSIVSADPHDAPTFHPNYLDDERDVDVMLEGVKAALKTMNTTPFKKLGAKWNGKKIPGCKDYKFMSDEYFKCYIKHYTFGLYHQVGTCKMGPDADKFAVLDDHLRVRGVQGLRVADMSICPQITSGNTMAPAIMIGEKAAAIILDDWTKHDEL